jgi:hypothetical protein
MRIIDFLVSINQRLQQEIAYELRFEPGVQTPEQTLRAAKGSCRDTGWLLVQILRHLGLAARFVSGYLVQLSSDLAVPGRSLGTGEGLHRPARLVRGVHAGGRLGRAGPDLGAVRERGPYPAGLHAGPGLRRAITGATDKCEVHFSFSNEVTRVHEDPRVTKPYTEAQWDSIDALGRRWTRTC